MPGHIKILMTSVDRKILWVCQITVYESFVNNKVQKFWLINTSHWKTHPHWRVTLINAVNLFGSYAFIHFFTLTNSLVLEAVSVISV